MLIVAVVEEKIPAVIMTAITQETEEKVMLVLS